MQSPTNKEDSKVEERIENLTSKTVRGIKWNSVATITNAVVQLGYSAIMARILGPGAFGLMAMSNVVLGFCTFFSQMGMGSALIHKKDLYKEDIRVAFTSSFILGAFFFVFAWIAAPLSLYIFDNSELVPVLRVTCFNLLITGLNSTSISLLRRRLEFKAFAIIQIISYVLGYVVVGVALAYLGFGVWSLVYASIFQNVLQTLVSYIFARHSLLLLFDWKYYKPLFAFGSKMSLITFMDFFGGELDTLLIGRFLGQNSLGLYNRSFLLIKQPVNILVQTISRVLFPAFSKIQNEVERLKKVYLFSVSSVVLIIFPISAGISVASGEIVRIMLGEKWTAAIPILQVLAFTTPFRVLLHFSGIVCDATATLNLKAILNFVYFILLAILFFIFKPLGLQGFTYAVLIAAILKNLGYYLITHKILNLNLNELLRAYKPGIFSAIITSIVIFLAGFFLKNLDMPVVVVLFGEIMAGVVGWLFSLYIAPDKTLLLQISSKFSNGFGSKTSASPFGQILSKAIKILTN